MANYQVGQPGGDWTGLTQGNVNNQAFQAAQQQAEHVRLVGYAETAAIVRVKLSCRLQIGWLPTIMTGDDYCGPVGAAEKNQLLSCCGA